MPIPLTINEPADWIEVVATLAVVVTVVEMLPMIVDMIVTSIVRRTTVLQSSLTTVPVQGGWVEYKVEIVKNGEGGILIFAPNP